jgi:hypothetical protein
MSDYLLEHEKKALNCQLKVTEYPLSYKNQHVDHCAIALAIDIPYPILIKWYELVGTKDEQEKPLDFVDLLNFWSVV